MQYYKTTSIPVCIFFEFLETEDYSLLVKSKSKKKLTDKKKQKIDEAFKNIFYEYCFLTQNTSLFDYYKNQIALEEMQIRESLALNILENYNNTGLIDVLMILNNLGFPISKEKDIEKQIESTIIKIKHLRNKINLKRIKINKKKPKTTKLNIEEEAIEIETALKMNYPIDTQTCTLKRWCALINKIKSK